MQVTSTTTNTPRPARARKVASPNAVKPARSAKQSQPTALAEIDLIRAYQAGDERAGSALLQTYARVIHETARPYFRRSHRDDLLQEARLGFLAGVKGFDEAAGVKLTTYVVSWIQHSAERYVAEYGSPIRVPIHAHGKTANERAKGRAQNAKRCCRLDAPLEDTDGETLGDLLPDGRETPETVAAIASQGALYRRVMAPLLEALSPLEREILLRHVMVENGSEETHAAVGAAIGVSRERAKRMYCSVLEKLRRELAKAGLNAMADVDEADLKKLAQVQPLPRVRKNGVG